MDAKKVDPASIVSYATFPDAQEAFHLLIEVCGTNAPLTACMLCLHFVTLEAYQSHNARAVGMVYAPYVELYTCSDTGLGRKRKIRWFCFENLHLGFFGVFHPRSFSLHLTLSLFFFKHVRLASCWVHPMMSVNAACASAFSLHIQMRRC
jgi:hypothetical protein